MCAEDVTCVSLAARPVRSVMEDTCDLRRSRDLCVDSRHAFGLTALLGGFDEQDEVARGR